MRVVAGTFRSRRLHSLPGLDIRPTSDRLRETLFNILTAGNPAALEGSVWVDLFAGTGAVGIEALSRGARMVYFVDNSQAAVEITKRNLQSLGITGGFQIIQQESARAIAQLDRQQVKPNFVFMDPPYSMRNAYQAMLDAVNRSSLSECALLIAEHEKRFDPGDQFGEMQRFHTRLQGDAGLSFYRRT
jgi:16S rRNA (guanine(966)-N(2))-methyltransferase RsmD